MENHIWITHLQKRINHCEKILNLIERYHLAFYLFGSAKIEILPRDVDILITYNDQLISFKNVWGLKVEIKKILLSFDTNIKFDLLILSVEEEKEINFIRSEEAIFIDGIV